MKLFCYRLNSYRSLAGKKTCWEGEFCPYEHDWNNVDLCELWTKDMCRRPQRLCEMRHFYFDGERERLKDKTIKDGQKNKRSICSKWQEGKCWGHNGWGGEGCQYRHYYTEDDSPISVQQDESFHCTSAKFTSPLVVKVRKETEHRRLEEVDLDTGRRRSWVETTEHDVIDLTGGTPAKPRTPLSNLEVNSRANIPSRDRATARAPEKSLKITVDQFRRYVEASNDLASMDSGIRRRRASLRN